VDILNNEMNKLRNEIKTLKQRNSKYRLETDRLKVKIRELENRLDALL